MFTRRPIGTKSKEPKNPALSLDEVAEYRLRASLVQQQEQIARACKISFQVYQDHLREKYGMPEKFNINLDTGELTHG